MSKIYLIIFGNRNFSYVIYTVILSILKRERERFQIFVPKRYCVPVRTLLSVFDCLRPLNDQKSSETGMKLSERTRNVGRSETFQKRKNYGVAKRKDC
jgi:hypothetical protein